jgi:hypothetical protein
MCQDLPDWCRFGDEGERPTQAIGNAALGPKRFIAPRHQPLGTRNMRVVVPLAGPPNRNGFCRWHCAPLQGEAEGKRPVGVDPKSFRYGRTATRPHTTTM